jgi:glycosyltransferase involved in cell wall biosynthesis
MNLLVISHNYPRFVGDPAGAFVQRIATRAAARGWGVRVLAPHTRGAAEAEEDAGVRVRRFRYAPDWLERVGYTGDPAQRASRSPAVLTALPAYVWAFRRAVRGAVAEQRPDVVHAHWWLPGGWFARATGQPFLLTCHGSDVRLLEHRRFRVAAARVFPRARVVTSISRFLADEIAGWFPAVGPRLQILPMPVDVAHFERGRCCPKAEPPRILYAGNLVRSKGVEVLLRAVAQLRGEGVPCRLRILGEGSEEAALRRLSTELSLGPAVEWSPFVKQDRMPDEYGAATVTVLPSRGKAEGLGLALVEALLAGSAAIGTRVGGIPEIVEDGVTGLLVSDGSVGDLAAALRRLLTDGDLRARLTAAGGQRARATYGLPASDAYVDLYERCAASR